MDRDSKVKWYNYNLLFHFALKTFKIQFYLTFLQLENSHLPDTKFNCEKNIQINSLLVSKSVKIQSQRCYREQWYNSIKIKINRLTYLWHNEDNTLRKEKTGSICKFYNSLIATNYDN